jgi:hypothetical protein
MFYASSETILRLTRNTMLEEFLASSSWGLCEDCEALQELNGLNPPLGIQRLRGDLSIYSGLLDDAKQEQMQLMKLLKEKDEELAKQNSTIHNQGMELGRLRKKVKEPPMPDPTAIMNKVPFAKTEYGKRVLNMAAIGFISPILSGFNTLEDGLKEHRWDPYVTSLFTELQEAVRRNNHEEVCEIHDRMHSFAQAFDNDFKERLEKAEKDIVAQCKAGLGHMLSLWRSDNQIY